MSEEVNAQIYKNTFSKQKTYKAQFIFGSYHWIEWFGNNILVLKAKAAQEHILIKSDLLSAFLTAYLLPKNVFLIVHSFRENHFSLKCPLQCVNECVITCIIYLKGVCNQKINLLLFSCQSVVENDGRIIHQQPCLLCYCAFNFCYEIQTKCSKTECVRKK